MNSSSSSNRRPDRSVEPVAAPFPSMLHALTGVDGPDIMLVEGPAGAASPLAREELLELGARFGRHLTAVGVEPGDTVLIALPTGRALLGALFGAWCAGARVSLMPPTGPLGRRSLSAMWLERVLDAIDPAVLVGERAIFDLARSLGAKQPILLDAHEVPGRGLGQPDIAFPTGDQIAVVQLTSGSTGTPRPVQVTHANIIANVRAVGERIGAHRGDRLLSWLPLHHDMGLVGGLLYPLYHRAPLRLMPTEAFVRDPASWIEEMSRFRATLCPAPPFAFSLLGHRMPRQRLAGIDLSSWRVAFIGAETIYPDVLATFTQTFAPCGFNPRAFAPCYGLAEATLAVTMVAANADYRVLWGDLQALRSEGRLEPRLPNSRGAVPFVGVGGALAETEILIADPAGPPLPDRRVGRILVRGPGVTASARGGAAMLDTGDLGFRCDGELFFAGRAKDIIIRSGANISPTDLESAAEEVAGVRRGAVAAFSCVRPERGRDEIIVAVEARRDAMNRREALAAEVQLHVSRRAAVQVDEVVVVAPASLPKTTSGKIQRSLCRDLYLADELRKRVGPGRLLRLIGRIKAGLSR